MHPYVHTHTQTRTYIYTHVDRLSVYIYKNIKKKRVNQSWEEVVGRRRWPLTVVLLCEEEGDRSRHSPSIEAAKITMVVTMATSKLSRTLKWRGNESNEQPNESICIIAGIKGNQCHV